MNVNLQCNIIQMAKVLHGVQSRPGVTLRERDNSMRLFLSGRAMLGPVAKRRLRGCFRWRHHSANRPPHCSCRAKLPSLDNERRQPPQQDMPRRRSSARSRKNCYFELRAPP